MCIVDSVQSLWKYLFTGTCAKLSPSPSPVVSPHWVKGTSVCVVINPFQGLIITTQYLPSVCWMYWCVHMTVLLRSIIYIILFYSYNTIQENLTCYRGTQRRFSPKCFKTLFIYVRSFYRGFFSHFPKTSALPCCFFLSKNPSWPFFVPKTKLLSLRK